MTSTSFPARIGRWVAAAFRRGPRATAEAAEPEPVEPIGGLRQQAAAAVIELDTAIRALQEELGLAQTQIGAVACRRLVTALDSARELSFEALTLHRVADQITGATSSDEMTERERLARVLELSQRGNGILEDEEAEFARMRELRATVPKRLDDLSTRADEIERNIPAAEKRLADLRAEHPEPALASIVDSVPRASQLISAGRDLVASGRRHLTDGDNRAAAVSAARAAEDALRQAKEELCEVDRAEEALATADEDVRQALNSIHAGLNDVRRLRATDETTTAAVKRADPIIKAATTVRRSGQGDLLAALSTLEDAERDIDDALVSYREEAEHLRRAQVHLERRILKASKYIAGVDRRIAVRYGNDVGATPRALLIRADDLVEQSQRLAPRDVEAARTTLEEAMHLARKAQAELDNVVMASASYHSSDDGPDLVGALLGAVLGADGDGGSRGGGSSGGFGGGGRF